VLGHKVSEAGASGGVERLGAAMAIAFLFIMPIVLKQIPSLRDTLGVLLVMTGVAVHRPAAPATTPAGEQASGAYSDAAAM
jgi:inner membrane transporter RhtA